MFFLLVFFLVKILIFHGTGAQRITAVPIGNYIVTLRQQSLFPLALILFYFKENEILEVHIKQIYKVILKINYYTGKSIHIFKQIEISNYKSFWDRNIMTQLKSSFKCWVRNVGNILIFKSKYVPTYIDNQKIVIR